ncbi:hypothetical protein VST7929_02170 [Vibrio stylophorae]|uniref:HTH merR-type domain-containing protein n=1 Tax=Vibrio stylophorae TaxID=659351 RepID=A0ABM8ZVM5_9VIBR|nr:MerR family transcriptional regulator [Vibrio stylophorae]CAH0534255.1 hypothetical protein VST7929_02170 [Vibrio stylophorae]
MYQISELAKCVGLSRATLLYYEKLGLIAGTRQSNGYRCYSERDLQRLKLLQKLQAGGLSLKECLACLEAKMDRDTLQQRLHTLDTEIEHKKKARDLLAAMLGEHAMRDWHQSLELSAPQAHFDWLLKQGFDEKHALRLKWLSKDMNEHDQYMADFERLFEGLVHLGPSSEDDVLRALHALPIDAGKMLEIGCGKGASTLPLAKASQFQITALDNDEYSLSCVQQRAIELGFSEQITTHCASMTQMPFEAQQFDLLWAEGSAYIMGVTQALSQWRALLRPQGYLVLSDLVWLLEQRDPKASEFWQLNYPDMSTVAQRLQQMQAAGYAVVDHFTLTEKAWQNYLMPLNERLSEICQASISSNAWRDLNTELEIHRQFLGQYGYHMFILKRVD